MSWRDLTSCVSGTGRNPLTVTNPFDGTEIGVLAQQAESDINAIVERAKDGSDLSAALPRHERSAILNRAATLLESRHEDFANLIVREAGKTMVQALKEVARAVNTLRLSAIEASHNTGELIPFSAYPGSEKRKGWYEREPLGTIVAITPYNDALNLVAHKVGPALAGGNSIILKPSQQTPFVAHALISLLQEAGLPEKVVTIVLGDRRLTKALVSNRNIRMVSFTGGFQTGEAIASYAGLKRLTMELGGNAPVIVFGDADLSAAVDACVSGSFWAAGQNCIKAQRIMIHQSVYDEFTRLFVSATSRLVVGDPTLESTDVGPMISLAAAQDAARKVRDAVAQGAELRYGGENIGSLMQPTVLTGVPESCEVWAEEVFAPIVTLEPFESESDAIERANKIEYSLHAGVFTKNIDRAYRLAGAIDAGGVMINDSSDYRFDAMPFGGSKYGSMGREGVKFAYEEMTQPKVVCVSL